MAFKKAKKAEVNFITTLLAEANFIFCLERNLNILDTLIEVYTHLKV